MGTQKEIICVTAFPRFWEKVKLMASGCWEWNGAKGGRDKRPTLKMKNHTVYAHRVSWELNVGPIPYGMQVLHTCDNPSCVNPKHLFLGSQLDNIADMVCKNRHQRGEEKPRAKLTNAQALKIRSSVGTLHSIAVIYGISKETVRKIKIRKRWKHVHGAENK